MEDGEPKRNLGSHPEMVIAAIPGLWAKYCRGDSEWRTAVVAFGRNTDPTRYSSEQPRWAPCVLNADYEIVFADSLDDFSEIKGH